MENPRGPLAIVPLTVAFLASLFGLSITVALNAILATAHYLGGVAAFVRLGSERTRLSDDSLIGETFAWIVPDAELAQLYALGLTGAIFFSGFIIARLIYRGFSNPVPDTGRFARHLPFYLLRAQLVLLVCLLGCFGFLAYIDYRLYVFRAASDALLPLFKGAYLPMVAERWDLVVSKYGHLAAIELVAPAGVAYLAATAASAALLEFAATTTGNTWLDLLAAVGGDTDSVLGADADADDDLRVVIGATPEERILLSDARDRPDEYVIDDDSNIYLKSYYDQILLDAERNPTLNGSGKKHFVIALAVVALGLFSGAPAFAASRTPTASIAIVVDPTGSFPFAAEAQRLVVELIKTLAPESTDPRRSAKPAITWHLISLDAYPRIILHGTEQDLAKLSDDNFRRMFADRKAVAHCTDVGAALRVAAEAVGAPDLCKRRAIYILSDLRNEPPNPTPKKPKGCKVASFSPPEDLPWSSFSGVEITTFFTPLEAIAKWTPVVEQHQVRDFVLYSNTGPDAGLPKPKPNDRCRRDPQGGGKFLRRFAFLTGGALSVLTLFVGGSMLLRTRLQRSRRPNLRGSRERS